MASSNLTSQPQEPLILLVPGLDGSGPKHWQQRWAQEIENCQIADLGTWSTPHRNTWINRLNLAVYKAGRPIILVAHSLGCILTAWWSKFEQPEWGNRVVGALLVAPPEVDFFPRDDRLTGFAPTPSDGLPFPSILVASRNDPWIGFDTAKHLAKQWGSTFVDAGNAGHINADSGLGSWPEGKDLLAQLVQTTQSVTRTYMPKPLSQGEGIEWRA